ncbi:MAG: peptidase [Rhodospirillales bacterium]|nr:peptidase [Rhodospirillales bacterium]MCW8861737.1 peptidase [Rhodospirillales bacterium]MCW8951817.1 peptidase [Rhodospirillales bacterium]MCW8970013.1 peptidase [Rhodospirillales bacterium]MCW9003382.1 peptidase [Rhodospirillales bacterium]
MTYCVGMVVDEGLVMVSDSRTNAGVDHISVFRKLSVWEDPGQRVIALASAGNLSISQSVVDVVNEGLPLEKGEDPKTMMTVDGMRDAARLIGQALRTVDAEDGEALRQQGMDFNAAFLLGGQVKGGAMRLFHIYAAGNFIEATDQTPFFQIGETKYGKPILDRVVDHSLSIQEGIKLALISMDSTLRSNISVGLPLDLLTIQRGTCKVNTLQSIEEDNPYFRDLQKRWGRALRTSFHRIPGMPA